jgi:type IV pilus assembly protein PilQ
MNTGRVWGTLLICAAVLGVAGCLSSRLEKMQADLAASDPAIVAIEKLFAEQRYSDALIKCNDLSRTDPYRPGLAELRRRVVDAHLAERARLAQIRSEPAMAAMAVDVAEHLEVPETYGLKLRVEGEEGPLLTESSPMEKVLDLPVTLHFTNLPLPALVSAIGAAANVNVIVDSSMEGDAASKTLAIDADDVPLSEILDYVSRNLGVAFYAGQNIIWATRQTAQPELVPMETRIYRLRKGLALDQEGINAENNIMKAIDMFVPMGGGDGSAVLLDQETHTLIVKNTREKLRKVEQIVDELDRTPPQVLIEARFISADVNDLRELGIDWEIGSIPVTKRAVLADGKRVEKTRTQLGGGEVVNFQDFPNQNEGLNLTYQGVLTAPKFEAVLHALESSQKTKTLSVPRITAVNNSPASIHVGETFLYWTEFEPITVQSYEDESGRIHTEDRMAPVGSPQEKPLGITLDVTPTVGHDLKTITLSLHPRIDQFVRYEEQMVAATSQGAWNDGRAATPTNDFALLRLPIFREQKMETKVIVQSGETVVLGGLITTVEGTKVDKIPILGSLPIVGHLFRHESKDDLSQNLLVFVTATIISQRGEHLVPVR